MAGVSQRGPFNLAAWVAVEKNYAGIGPVIVGIDRASLVEFVHDDRLDFSSLDKVVAGYCPIGGAGNRISRGQFFELACGGSPWGS